MSLSLNYEGFEKVGEHKSKLSYYVGKTVFQLKMSNMKGGNYFNEKSK